MVPLQVTRHGIDGLDHVSGLWHIQNAVVSQRRALLAPGRESS